MHIISGRTSDRTKMFPLRQQERRVSAQSVPFVFYVSNKICRKRRRTFFGKQEQKPFYSSVMDISISSLTTIVNFFVSRTLLSSSFPTHSNTASH